MKPHVFVTRKIPHAGLSILETECHLQVWDKDTPPSKEELLSRVPTVDGLLCLLTDPIDQNVISKGANRLKVISTYAVGFDNIDINAATDAGIPVGNTPGVLTETTADLAFSLMLSAARRIVEGQHFAAEGKWKTWSPTLLLGNDIYGATLGIVGMGRIGQAVAKRASGFNMRVLYTGPSAKKEADLMGAEYVPLDTLLAQSDFISLHMPLTSETKHMFNGEIFAKMKSNAILVNTARGGVINQDDLYTALSTGTIAYGALDVTDPEPLPSDHKLYGLSNCIIIPHLGSASIATRDKMARMAAENILAGLRGDPLPNCVNPQIYG